MTVFIYLVPYLCFPAISSCVSRDLVASLGWKADCGGGHSDQDPVGRLSVAGVGHVPPPGSAAAVGAVCFSRLQTILIGLWGESPWHLSPALYLPGDNPFRCLELTLMSPSYSASFLVLSGSLSHAL